MKQVEEENQLFKYSFFSYYYDLRLSFMGNNNNFYFISSLFLSPPQAAAAAVSRKGDSIYT
jgi:hypothetical protein